MNKKDKLDLLNKTDLCVKCGLCLPYCPTYDFEKNEAESPRGRISLIQGLASNYIKLHEPNLSKHLDNCLKCNHCEQVCPAQVPFTEILLAGQALLYPQSKHKKKFKIKLILHYSRYALINRIINGCVNLAALLLKVIPKTCQRALSSFIATHYLYATKVFNQPRFSSNDRPPANPTNRNQVGLFIGCTGKLFATTTIEATTTILKRLGLNVYLPKSHHCCGGLLKTVGNSCQADQLENKNMQLFNMQKLDYLITIANGCYDFLARSSSYSQYKDKITDLYTLILKHQMTHPLHFAPYPKKVAIHIPCSLNYYPNIKNDFLSVLKQIPKIKIFILKENYGCCGASGLHMVKNPTKALNYTQPIIKQIKTIQPNLILSNNTGCCLHIRHALINNNLNLTIQHPNDFINQLLI